MKSFFTFISVLLFCFISQSFLFAQDFQVTIITPSNGQIEVFNGGTLVTSGENIAINTELTIRTTPNEGYQLRQILVNGSPLITNPYVITEEVIISAEFAETPPAQNFTVTITPPTNGLLEIFNGETLINSGEMVPENTELTIVASPDPGYRLHQIFVNDNLIEGNIYILSQNITVSAEFVEALYAELTIERPTNGKFIIEYIKDGVDLQETISNTSLAETFISVDEGTEVSVKAIGNLNYSLRNWTNDFSDNGNINPLLFPISGQKRLGGNFAASPILTIPKPANGQIEISYIKQGDVQNDVFSSDALESNLQLRVDIGTLVELTAVTNSDFQFIEWKGDFPDTQKTIIFMMNETSVLVEAIFFPIGAEIQVLLDRILAVTNKNNSDVLKNAQYIWSRNGNKLTSNVSEPYVEVGNPIPTGEYTVNIVFPNKTQVTLRRSFGTATNVYPNPVAKNRPVTILSENVQELTCEVYTITGNKINASITPMEKGFSISGIANQGTYFVHLKDKNSTSVLKFTVQ